MNDANKVARSNIQNQLQNSEILLYKVDPNIPLLFHYILWENMGAHLT